MKKGFVLASLAIVIFSGCRVKVPEGVVVKCEFGEITTADLELQMTCFAGTTLERIENYSALGGGEQALKDIIAERRLSEKAVAEGIESVPAFQSEITSKERDVLISAVARHLIVGQSEPTHQEIEDYFNEHRDLYDVPDQAKVRSVFLPVHPGATQAEEESTLLLAQDLVARITEGRAAFEDIAREYSKAPTAEKGGEEPLVAKGVFPATVEMQIFSTKEGDLTEIVRTRSGYIFFQVEKTLSSREVTLDEVRDKVASAVRKEKVVGIRDAIMQEMRERDKVSVYPEVFLGGEPDPHAVAITTASKDYTVSDVFKRFSQEMFMSLASSGVSSLQPHLENFADEILLMKKARDLRLDETEEVKDQLRIWRVRTLAEAYVGLKCLDVPMCTEEELQTIYAKNQERYQKPKQIAFREIFVGIPSDLDPIEYQRHLEAARALAEDIQKRLDEGEDFGGLARKHSTVGSASNGGYVDWVSIEELGSQPYMLADPLKQGEVAGPALVRGGYLLVKMEGVRPPEPMSFGEARERVQEDSKAQKTTAKREQILREAYSMDGVEVYRENFQKALSTIKPR